MANHRNKSGYHGCTLCKPWKSQGNSKDAIKFRYKKLLLL
jgi:hypothetical protein